MRVRGQTIGKGFTLVELLVVVAVAVVLLAISIPSFRTFIVEQRLQSVTAQVVTDLQFARAEATARNRKIYVSYQFNAGESCYAIFSTTIEGMYCGCTGGVSGACFLPAQQTLIRIHSVPKSASVELHVGNSFLPDMAFDNVTGGIVWGTSDFTSPTPTTWSIDARVVNDATRWLRVQVSPAGRTSICNVGSRAVGGYPACS